MNIKKFPHKTLVQILFLSVFLIIVASVESLYAIKDIHAFEEWKSLTGKSDLNEFISIGLVRYFSIIFIPMLLSLYSYISYVKFGYNRWFQFVWIALLTTGIINIIFYHKKTPFSVFAIVMYVLLMVIVFRLDKKEE